MAPGSVISGIASLIRSVAPPPFEAGAIRLRGRSRHPISEAWEVIEATSTRPGDATPDRPELWVRNVAMPTLTPFLPDPAIASGAAMIVAPGGAFIQLAIEREGYRVAEKLSRLGIAAFVLKYRLAPTHADPGEADREINRTLDRVWSEPENEKEAVISGDQLEAIVGARDDGLAAVRYLRANAESLNVSVDRIGFMGFSAGALTALNVALTEDAPGRPDLVAPFYGMLLADMVVTPKAPPAFIAAAADDALAVESQTIFNTWRANSVTAELHIFEHGGHGFGMLNQGRASDQWLTPFEYWLRYHLFLR